MLRSNRPVLAFFDSIKALRVRQLALILKAGYDPNLMLNGRGQNGLQFMIHYFGATEAHYRLQAPINMSAYLAIAKLLLDSGLDPNAMELLTDETVLFDAIRYNDKEMVALLLNYVDLALRNKNGETALMCAARFGSKQVTRLILDHLRHLEMDGYFLRQRNRFGLTALELARSENLEAAKVLTKHLIAFGHHTGAVLARSVSHHQLAGAAVDYAAAAAYRPPVGLSGRGRGRGPHAAAAAASALLVDECISPSDYDSDIHLGHAGPVAAARARPALMEARAGRRPRAAYPYYDPRAAEFSQYLLDQQLALAGAGGSDELEVGQLGCGPGGRALSEDDDLYGGGPGGQLVRSRSCMLGPSGSGAARAGGVGGYANASGAAAAAAKSKAQQADQAAKMSAAAGWQDQSSGGAGAGQ